MGFITGESLPCYLGEHDTCPFQDDIEHCDCACHDHPRDIVEAHLS